MRRTVSSPAEAPVRGSWQPSWLLAAPHRLCFFVAASLLAATALWWLAALLARAAGTGWPWAVAPAVAHSLLMGFAFMPLFFAGFLFTAGPKWLMRPSVDARVLLAPVGAYALGWGMFGIGVHFAEPLAAGGVALAAFAWSVMTWRFIGLLRASTVDDLRHATLVAL